MNDQVSGEYVLADDDSNLKNLNDHIPEEDYEYTEYSKTNKTNDQQINAMSESEGHKDLLSERLAPVTAQA